MAAAAVSSAGSAAAATSSGTRYADVKTVFDQMYDKNNFLFSEQRNGDDGEDADEAPEGPQYDLIYCVTGSDFYSTDDAKPAPGDRKLAGYADLARDVSGWRHRLQELGYPSTVWAPIIDAYERNALAAIANASPARLQRLHDLEGNTAYARVMKRLKTALGAYRDAHPNAHLARIVVDGGCGAGQNEITLGTRPTGGSILVVPMFFYRLCKVEHLDPDDPKRCDRWREVVGGVLELAFGDYAYQVRWPDGARRSGKISLDGLELDKPLVFTKP